jgi:subtilisin family serine protease
MPRLRVSLALLLLLTSLVGPVVLAQGPTAGIEPALLDRLAVAGHADLVVSFAATADLAPAYQMDWEERGVFVVQALTAVAESSQAHAREYLASRGLAFRPFIAGNELYVWAGDLQTVQDLAALPGVSYVRGARTYYIDPLLSAAPGQAPQALAWGIDYTDADLFWNTFGVRGNGVVVANIDTGVQWNHPALDQSFKCGANPSDPACWADPSDICGGVPCDNNGHGTHTMGTMVGDDDPSLTYQAGMAPGAQWIACKGCESTSCSDFALNACADWLLQPGGSAANRPHVVNNSWGGYGGDNWYLAKVNAWRAAGIFPAFSAGNNGSGCGSLGSPGDYQESFATAAVDASGDVADFSSRGPSAFGHDPYTKPNIAAPGVYICSSLPTNRWSCSYSGTSMASPHSAGAVALL